MDQQFQHQQFNYVTVKLTGMENHCGKYRKMWANEEEASKKKNAKCI